MPIQALTAARLRDLLSYSPETGEFVWRRSAKGRPVRAGARAGSPHSGGYLSIGIGGRNYLAHRLAWMYAHGQWPQQDIDHIDGDRRNNRIANLRDVSRAMNCQNRRREDMGVSFHKRDKRWLAQIHVDSKKRHLGSFATRAEAQARYMAAKRVLHPGCTI